MRKHWFLKCVCVCLLVCAGWGGCFLVGGYRHVWLNFSVLYFYNKDLMENRIWEVCCDLCVCCRYSPSVCDWDRKTVHLGGISLAPESGTAWSSEKTACRNKQDGQRRVEQRAGRPEERRRAHLPPKVCCRSCRWNKGSWYSGPRQNEGRSQGSESPRRESCCMRADGWGQSLAWRTCGETDEEIKFRIYSTKRKVELSRSVLRACYRISVTIMEFTLTV